MASIIKAAQREENRRTALHHVTIALFLLIMGSGFGIGTCLAGTYAYIPNMGNDTISVLRTSDHTIINDISCGEAPYGGTVYPGGEYLYVTNNLSNTVSVIDTLDGCVTDTLVVGNAPKGLAIDAEGEYLFVANSGDDTVSIIELNGEDGNQVITTTPVGVGPEGVAADPDGHYIYVTNYLDDSVSIITAENDPVTLTVGAGPIGITADPDREYIYVANFLEGTVTVIDINGEDILTDDEGLSDDNQIIATIPVGTGPWDIAVGLWGETAYVSNYTDNTVSVIDLDDMAVSATVPVGNGPKGLASARNGSYVYVLNQDDETVSIIDMSDNSVTTLDAGAGTSPVGLGCFLGGTVPSAPGSFSTDDKTETSITLEWTDSSYEEVGFKLERRLSSSEKYALHAVIDSNVTEFTDTDLESGTTYYYRLVAYTEAGDSDALTLSPKTEDESEDLLDSITGGACFISNVADTSPGWLTWVISISALFPASILRFFKKEFDGKKQKVI